MKKNKNVIMRLLILSIIFVLSMSFMAISYANEDATEEVDVTDVADNEERDEVMPIDIEGAIDTEAELIEAIAQGEEVTLGGSFTVTKTIEINENVTLNLGEYDITGGEAGISGAIIKVTGNGNLTITGNGEIKNNKERGIAIRNDGGILTISGGTYDAACALFAGDHSETTITGGTFIGSDYAISTNGKQEITFLTIGTKGDNQSVQVNGTIYFPAAAEQGYTINGGTFRVGEPIRERTEGGNAVLEIKRGSLTINGGDFSCDIDTTNNSNADTTISDNQSGSYKGTIVVSKNDAYADDVTVTITGGIFTNNAGDAIVMVNQAKSTSHDSTITIENETEATEDITIDGNVANYTTTSTNTNTISIGTGTTVNGSVIGENIKIGEGAKILEKDSKVDVIVDNEVKSSFDTIEEALNFVTTSGATLKLKQDVEGGFDVGISDNKDITIDLNGHTIKFKKTVGSSGTVTNGIRVLHGSTLVLKNGKLDTDNLTDLRFVIANYGTMTLEDVEILDNMAKVIYTINNRGELTLKGKTTVPTGQYPPKNSGLSEGFAITNDPYNYVYVGEAPKDAILNVSDPNVIVGKVQVEQYERDASDDNNTGAKIQINISAGKFGSIVSDGKDFVEVEPNIIGGFFKEDPSNYVKGDFVVVGTEDPEYLYTITKKNNNIDVPVETYPGASSLDDDNSYGLTRDQFTAESNVLIAYAKSVANNSDIIPYSSEEVKDMLIKQEISVQDDVMIVVEPYIEIKEIHYDQTSNATLTFDVEALYNLIATTASNVEEMKLGSNAAIIKTGILEINNTPIELTFGLPKDFVTKDEELFVHHKKGDKTYIYETIKGDNNTITFTNRHGFSEFEVTKDGGVAENKTTDIRYRTLQAAIDDVKDDEQIVLLVSNNEFVTVSRNVSFVFSEGSNLFSGSIEAGSGYKRTMKQDEQTGSIRYTFTQSSGGSSSGGGSGVTKYKITVTVGPNGNVTPSGNVRVEKGKDQRFDITPNNGYVVEDVKVDGESVGAVTSYTFEDVTKAHTLSVTFKAGNGTTPTEPSTTNTRYTDVGRNAWFYNAIEYVSEKGLMQGTGANKFDPDISVTRGMMATVLYRLSGANTNGTSTFTDVPAGSYYSNAIAWAAEKGIVTGVGENRFDPERAIKREEMATMIARYISTMEVSIETSGEAGSAYADAGTISSFATEAVTTMKTTGLMEGKNGNNFDPAGLATRAEVATILMRFVEKTTTK